MTAPTLTPPPTVNVLPVAPPAVPVIRRCYCGAMSDAAVCNRCSIREEVAWQRREREDI